MLYQTGSAGRIFYIRFDHDEDLLGGIQEFAEVHQIRSGMIHLIGAVSEGSLVTGPKETVLPPDQVWNSLSGAHEFIGTGFIRAGRNGPKVHLHAAAGREDSVFVGCFRENTRIYILIEAVIIEFSGFCIRDVHDPLSGLSIPEPGK
jgi:predicted DNA-binding protein with PD1-like motif